jgi:release factor glutamine methyltransferase
VTGSAPTWRTLRADAAGALTAAGIGPARQEADWLVEEASGWSSAELAGRLDDRPGPAARARHEEMLARRLAGEPLQYVLGRWSFRSLDLAVDRRALIPRPETEQVVEMALAELDRLVAAGDGAPAVVDLGTGSGAIALSVAVERPVSRVWATDRSPDALALARANLAGIGRAGARVRIVEGHWFDALPAAVRGRVGVVVANPPYIPEGADLPAEVSRWEPDEALRSGAEGLDDLAEIVAGVSDWLVPGGAVVVELGPAQAGPVQEMAAAAGLVDVVVGEDLSSRPRMVRARRPG